MLNDYAIIHDCLTGVATIKNNGYIRTKDSQSKSGHSLIAQIEMTHSGIVTGNYGFYLPDRMRAGAATFTKDYCKPVIVGHDLETEPLGRVIDAKYVDTSKDWKTNDKMLSTYLEFNDAKKKKVTVNEDEAEFARYVIENYWGKDNYRGLGHIYGTLKISDAKAIEKILDERYLTVSTGMRSGSARCSECGQDWVRDGFCEHEKGKIYDSGIPVCFIPGNMFYDEVSVVNLPANKFAAKFSGLTLVKNGEPKEVADSEKKEQTKDNLTYTLNLFSYADKKLVSLADESETNILDVKDEIQHLENCLLNSNAEKPMTIVKKEQFLDMINASINLWKMNEEGCIETDVTIRKHVQELTEEQLKSMCQKALAALDSVEEMEEQALKDKVTAFVTEEANKAIADKLAEEEKAKNKKVYKVKKYNDKMRYADSETTYTDDDIAAMIVKIESVKDHNLSKNEVKELATLSVRSSLQDPVASLVLPYIQDEEAAQMIERFKTLKDKSFKLSDKTQEELLQMILDNIAEENRLSQEALSGIADLEYADAESLLAIPNKFYAEAVKTVLQYAKCSDSLKARMLANVERIAKKFVDATTPETKVATESTETQESGQEKTSTEEPKQAVLTDEEVIKKALELISIAKERGLELNLGSDELSDKDKEIAILEQQLDAANDEIEQLSSQIASFQDEMKKNLVEKVIEKKIEKIETANNIIEKA
jgi:hypothetical protein